MDVSIIIPVYNVAPYIEACLKSVLRQTYTGSMECLLVDDCGTDESISIVERMIAEYDGLIRFEILHHDHNRGLSATRNTGTLHATGDYLYYIDSDDEMTDNCIELLMQKMRENPDLEMVQGNTIRCTIQNESDYIIKKVSLPLAKTNEEVRQCYYKLGQLNVMVWNKLFRRDFIFINSIFCKEGLLYEDNLFTFYMLKHLKKAAFIPETTYLYKLRPYSIMTSTDKSKKGLHFYTLYGDILAHLTPGYEHEEYNYYANKIGCMYFRTLRDVPVFKELFLLWKSKSRLLGNKNTRKKLTIYSFIGKFKYGWVAWSLMLRVKHPSLIPRDVRRIYVWCSRR